MDEFRQLYHDKLFQEMAPDEVETFIAHCDQKRYPDGTRLFEANTEAETLYLPVTGGIELRFDLPGNRGETILTTRLPGQAVGWSSIVPPHLYHFAGICKGTTEIYEMKRGNLQALFTQNYHFAYLFMRNVAILVGIRLEQVQEKLSLILGEEATTGW